MFLRILIQDTFSTSLFSYPRFTISNFPVSGWEAREDKQMWMISLFSCSLATFILSLLWRSECYSNDARSAVSFNQRYCCLKRQKKSALFLSKCTFVCVLWHSDLLKRRFLQAECVSAPLIAHDFIALAFWPGSAYGSSEIHWRVWSVSALPWRLWLVVSLNNVSWLEEIPLCSFKASHTHRHTQKKFRQTFTIAQFQKTQ